MHYWFTADTHLGHDNIRIRCKRPFLTIEEMDNTIINNWNKLVNGDDMVYILGDFTFGPCPCEKITNYIKQLKGNKVFIRGNHDRNLKKAIKGRFPFFDVRMIKIEEQHIFLSHYAHRVWDKSRYGTFHLYGHSHGMLPDLPDSLSMDVGVDSWNFAPVSFEQIKIAMSKKSYDEAKRR